MTNVEYDFKKLEEKWQPAWRAARLGLAEPAKEKKKFFMIFAYPNPSGFLHIGHMRGYTYTDIFCRYKRQHGYNVLFPVGIHASGNSAIGAALKVQQKKPDWIKYLVDNGVTPQQLSELESPEFTVEFFTKSDLQQAQEKRFSRSKTIPRDLLCSARTGSRRPERNGIIARRQR